jgi:hypothetical protein
MLASLSLTADTDEGVERMGKDCFFPGAEVRISGREGGREGRWAGGREGGREGMEGEGKRGRSILGAEVRKERRRGRQEDTGRPKADVNPYHISRHFQCRWLFKIWPIKPLPLPLLLCPPYPLLLCPPYSLLLFPPYPLPHLALPPLFSPSRLLIPFLLPPGLPNLLLH